MIYRVLVRPLLWLLPAESAHHVAFGALRLAVQVPGLDLLVRRSLAVDDPVLRVRAFGVDFPNPLGLAAGFDKNAFGPDALGALGFGFVEVGTITAQPQRGNPTPRLFRLAEDRALINRLGFNNYGADAVARRLRGGSNTVVGANIGKTRGVADERATEDYVKSAERLGPLVSYVVVNVSSPNTPGLRDLQSVEKLEPLLVAVREALDRSAPERRVPLLVKIAPDLADADIERVAELALRLRLDGIVATNTTVSREGLRTPPERVAALGAGGLSGPPLAARSREVLQRLRARLGSEIALVSVGGIATVEDAWQRIRSGASLLQIYTALVYEGPGLPRELLTGLAARIRGEGFATLQDAIGSAAAESQGTR